MTDLVTIFCETDDFCKYFEKQYGKKLLSNGKGIRESAMNLSMSEVMTISIWYHYTGYATFKDYYTKHVLFYLTKEFSNLVSYNRFIELRKLIVMPSLIFLTMKKLDACTGISFIDSFSLKSCTIKRAYSHKTLKNFARLGKTSMGWFYGMKVHLIINHKGEIVSFLVSPGNIADNNEQLLFKITKNIFGKLFGDKGYLVNSPLFEKLYKKGIRLVTKIRANMKNKLMPMLDKLLLRKRGMVESVGNILKNHLYMEHTRHRSPWAFFLNLSTSLIAYQMREKKPKIALDLDQITLPV
jgi:hypothetical protein